MRRALCLSEELDKPTEGEMGLPHVILSVERSEKMIP